MNFTKNLISIIAKLFLMSLLPLLITSCNSEEEVEVNLAENIIGNWKIKKITMGSNVITDDVMGNMTLEFTTDTMISRGLMGDGAEKEAYKISGEYIVGEDGVDRIKIDECTNNRLVLSGDMGGRDGSIDMERVPGSP